MSESETKTGTTPAEANEWIVARVSQARKLSSVADAAALEIQNRLNGALCERALSATELSKLAKVLLEAPHDSPAKDILQ